MADLVKFLGKYDEKNQKMADLVKSLGKCDDKELGHERLDLWY